jgi:hypothetical protein
MWMSLFYTQADVQTAWAIHFLKSSLCCIDQWLQLHHYGIDAGMNAYGAPSQMADNFSVQNLLPPHAAPSICRRSRTSNAGEVVKTIGAMFGKAKVNDLTFGGVGLYHRDRADSYEALMQLTLIAKLGVNASDRQVVDLLYTNIVGIAPSEDVAQQYVNMLSNGTYTQADLAVVAADTADDAVNIDLTGLRLHGLAFYEYS